MSAMSARRSRSFQRESSSRSRSESPPSSSVASCAAVHNNIREFLQIENVDVDVNVDVESHPLGSTTPHEMKVQGSKMYLSLPNMFAFFLSWHFPLKFTSKCRILVFEVRDKQSYLRSTVPHRVILHLCSRLRLRRFQFAETPYSP